MVTPAQASAAVVAVPLALLGAAWADAVGRRLAGHGLRAVAVLAVAAVAAGVAGRGTIELSAGGWLDLGQLGLTLDLQADGVAACVLGASAALVVLLSLLDIDTEGRQRCLASLAAAGVCLLALADAWLPLLLGWQIVVAAVLLAAARAAAIDGRSAQRIVLLTHAGTAALVVAAVLGLAAGGDEGLASIAVPAAPWLAAAAAVIGLGIWPLHLWLVDASPSVPVSATTGWPALAGACLLLRLGPVLPDNLADALIVTGGVASVLAATAALASGQLRQIPALGAAAVAGLVVWAAACEPAAALLLLAAALGSRVLTLASSGLLHRSLDGAAGSLDEVGGLAQVLPGVRWVALAGAVLPGLSGAGLWGQTLVLQATSERFGIAGLASFLLVTGLASLPLYRLALVPFAGAPRPTGLRRVTPPRSVLAAAAVTALLAAAGAPALAWWLLPQPPLPPLALVAAANVAGLGLALLLWRRGLESRTAPPSPAHRFAAQGFGAGGVLDGTVAGLAAAGRGLWTAIDTGLIGGAWGATNLALRGAGWVLARCDRGDAWAVGVGLGTALVVLWSMADPP